MLAWQSKQILIYHPLTVVLLHGKSRLPKKFTHVLYWHVKLVLRLTVCVFGSCFQNASSHPCFRYWGPVSLRNKFYESVKWHVFQLGGVFSFCLGDLDPFFKFTEVWKQQQKPLLFSCSEHELTENFVLRFLLLSDTHFFVFCFFMNKSLPFIRYFIV